MVGCDKAGRGVPGVALAAAALLCVALAGGWTLGATAAGQPGAAAGRRQFELAQRVGRTKQLESEAMREAALARLEAKRVKALQKELLSIKAKKNAPHAAQQSLNGDSDMQNGQREKGAGYWDKDHHDDNWVPVADEYSKLDKRKALWDSEVQASEGDKKFDAFVDDEKVEAPVVASANSILLMNSFEKEFSDDDDFVPPPSEITPAHRVPVQSYLPWEVAATQAETDLFNLGAAPPPAAAPSATQR
jgi:hypothetical protein